MADMTVVDQLKLADEALAKERATNAGLLEQLAKAQNDFVAVAAQINELKALADKQANQIKDLESNLAAERSRADSEKTRADEAEKKLANPAFMDVAGTAEKVVDQSASASEPHDLAAEFAKLTTPLERAKFVSQNKKALLSELK